MSSTKRLTRVANTLIAIHLTALIALSWSLAAQAEPVQKPDLRARANMRTRSNQVRRLRAATWKRVNLTKVPQRLLELNPKTPAGRHELAITHPVERAMLYVKRAREAGHKVSFSYRTVEGKNTANPEKARTMKKKKVKKLFIEVTNQTMELFHDIMGPNMVWPSGASDAYHLYTLFPDQGGGQKIQSNTYGENMTAANASSGKMAYGLWLTGGEMNRLVSYTNAGLKHRRAKVYGYKMSDGSYPSVACTNWLSSAPIGKKGPAAELQACKAEIREHFDKRPMSLANRGPLAKIFGLSRAQHPAIFTGRMMLAESIPVVAHFSYTTGTKLSKLSWGLGAVGTLGENGKVTGGAQ